MLPSPSSSPRPALVNRTNILTRAPSGSKDWVPPTPPEHGEAKRPCSGPEGGAKKRVKHSHSLESSGPGQGNNDLDTGDVAVVKLPPRRNMAFHLINQVAMRRPFTLKHSLSTRPILQSFVSSHKSDVFKCQSGDSNTFLSPPYACSYSNGAKRGGTPLLAVATEHGSVHILNTAKRDDWEFEPPRTIFHPHSNGVFDIKWNKSDRLLATCSGDRTTGISCPETSSTIGILSGHTSTVKCVAWDPLNFNLLSTGGRDGSVCLWDLRMSRTKTVEDTEVADGTISPVLTIPGAHGIDGKRTRIRGRTGKYAPLPRSITSLVYPTGEPHSIVSAGSFDGILRSWDLRMPDTDKKAKKPTTQKSFTPIFTSPFDPTTIHGSRRPRGLTSLINGIGPTSNLLFALGADSRVHTYSSSQLIPQMNGYTHENMQINSFYVRVALSPCGKWLASGSTGTGSAFLYDVSSASRSSMCDVASASLGVELKGQRGEVGAIDWAEGMLATCADDGSVRVWRPDVDVYHKCIDDPEESKWGWAWALGKDNSR